MSKRRLFVQYQERNPHIRKAKRNVRNLPTRTPKGMAAKPDNNLTKIKKRTTNVLASKHKQNVNESRKGKVQESLADCIDRQKTPSNLDQKRKLIRKRSKERVNKVTLKPTRASIRRVINQNIFDDDSEDSSYVDSEEPLSEKEGTLKITGENIDGDIVNKTVVLQFLPNGDIREDGQNIEVNTNVACNNEDNIENKKTTDSVSRITLPRDTNEPIDKAKKIVNGV